MPGQIPLDTKYYPADFNLTTVLIPTISTSGGAGMINVPVVYADKPIVIDSLRLFTAQRLDNGDGDNTDNHEFTFWVVTNTAIPTGTASSTQIQLTDVVSGAESVNAAQAFSFTIRSTGTTAANVIPAGATVWMRSTLPSSATGSTWTVGHTTGSFISVRWRSQL